MRLLVAEILSIGIVGFSGAGFVAWDSHLRMVAAGLWACAGLLVGGVVLLGRAELRRRP